MQNFRRMVLVFLTCILALSGTVVASAQSSSDALQNVQKQLDLKAKEKNSINQDIANIQKEMDSLYSYISKNKQTMAETQKRIAETQALIQQKREEIVVLQDKIYSRKDIMKNRLVALQEDDNVNVVISVFLESKNFADFIQRASAVTTLFNADKDIINEQEKDILQIEEEKKFIDEQERRLEVEQNNLAAQQAELNENLKKRQTALTEMQKKYSEVAKQMAMAEKEKAGIEAQIRAAQESIRNEQAGITAMKPVKPAAAPKGKEFYVSATAYSPAESGAITAAGYNIRQNPNLKLIAVDPSVIPLGTRVWVEGYGEAIAGDTGGAIKGYKIDVLMPTKARALQWGRKTVKIVILN